MLPHATAALDQWRAARAAAGRMLLALDFDGTLAPIAPTPAEATLANGASAALAALAARTDMRVAIVSGRALDDVADRVGAPELFYAGNHGFEVRGPGVYRRHEAAVAAMPALRACLDALRPALAAIDGVLIEDKELTASIHYRLVRGDGAEEEIRRIVRRGCGSDRRLRITSGKKVLEVRPALDWDKGSAVRFLADTLLDSPAAPVVFIGDDTTDEDAFRALAGRGAGVVVARVPPPGTHARYHVSTPDEVVELLRALAA